MRKIQRRMRPRGLPRGDMGKALAGEQQSLVTGPLAGMLYLEQWGNLTHGLTPSRLRNILDAADLGDIVEQHQLFADMEDRCDHLAAEMGKRKRALLTLDWEILPGTPKDKEAVRIAEAVREQFDALPDFEDLISDLADGIGHGFSALEVEWAFEEGMHLPAAFRARPQTWFTCLRSDRNQLRLRDSTVDGAELWPLGWVVHAHRSKSGWLPRAGLFRVLAWTYLIRAYALDANINYVQVHGLPLRLGKYPPGSSEADKTALMQALRYMGRDAAGIVPLGMEVLFETAPAASQDIPGMLVTRCEQGMSKAILGGTLTSQADGKTSTNALGNIHNEVRHDLLAADATQLASTISQQILAPLAWLNLGVVDRRLLPYFRFDTREAEDIATFADALPKLTPIMDISAEWAHDKLKIPRAKDASDILGAAARQAATASQPGAPGAPGAEDADGGKDKSQAATRASLAAPRGATGATPEPRKDAPGDHAQRALDNMQADAALAAAGEALLAPLLAELDAGLPPEALLGRLGELYPGMDEEALAEVLARAMFVAEVWGRVHA